MFQTYKDIYRGKVEIQGKAAEEYAHKAALALEAGNYRKALRWTTKAIEVETNNRSIAHYHGERAAIKLCLADYAGALTDCKIALKCERLSDGEREIVQLTRDSAKAAQYYHKTHVAMDDGNFRRALQYVTKAIEIEWHNVLFATYHVTRASIEVILGDHASALADCNIALKCKRLNDEDRDFAKLMQDIVKDRHDVKKAASNWKSTTGRVRTINKHSEAK
jgi:tetratricopeptide (TPR) repeat protein